MPSCDAATLLAAAQANGYSRLSARQLKECVALQAGAHSFGPPCAAVPSGIVSWYRAENSTADQEGNVNGTAVGAISYVPGEVGTAFSFPGDASSYVDLGTAAPLQLQTFTIELWRQRAVAGTTGPGGLGYGNFFTFGTTGWCFQEGDSNGFFDGELQISTAGGSAPSVLGMDAFPDDTLWHHAAVAIDSVAKIARFWLDGVPDSGNPNSINPVVFPFTFLGNAAIPSAVATTGFGGLLDEVSIYNRV